MKRLLVALLILLVGILLAFAGCNDLSGSPEESVDAEASQEVSEVLETTIDPNRKLVARASIPNSHLGIRVLSVENPNLYSIDTKVTNDGVSIVAYADGVTTLSFVDHFGHTASAEVRVVGEEIEVIPCPTTDEFIEVCLDFGAKGDGKTDNTAIFQAAIDSAKPGETVYVYPGIYRIDHISMREGVTLELYTTMVDAHVGFTDELANDVKNGNVSVISGGRIMNNDRNQSGSEGCSNFTIRGGVFDMNCYSKGAFIFGACSGVTLENIILKDIENNHSIQITGCTDVMIRNCMFAGYTWGGTFTREVLQVETSTPGATGAAATAPLRFKEGEFYLSANVEISHCYFGKSDELGAPIMAIGHHSQVGDATVTDFRILDNIFDEVLYAAIRYNNIVDTEISGNTFISTAKYKNVKHEDAKNPAFIIIYSNSANTTYTADNGDKITVATKFEQSGTHDLVIKNNTFKIGEGSDKKVIHVTGTSDLPGVIFQSGLTRRQFFNTESYSYSGYSYQSNCVEGLVFSDNSVIFEGKPEYKDYFMYFQWVRGLIYENNSISMPEGLSFNIKHENISGLSVNSCNIGTHSDRYVIKSGGKASLTLGNISIRPSGGHNVTILVEGGGHLDISDDGYGNASMTPVADEGYIFDGFYDENGKKLQDSLRIAKDATWTVKFIKK